MSVMSQPREHIAALVNQLANEALAFCGPIFIAPGLNTYPGQMIDNGTYSLINTGKKQILVTCHHVWQAYLDNKKDNLNAILAINLGDGNATVSFQFPERHLIDSNATLDLAVFDFESSQILVNKTLITHQKNWFPIQQWPIPKARDGEYVVLMGFPGRQIEKLGSTCIFKAQHLCFKISHSGYKEIHILNNGENIEVFKDVKHWLGGLSGSPAYTVGRNGTSLVGFVKSGSGSASESSIFSGCLLLTHASFLQPDGRLAQP